ncbi:inner centromere protein-like isoform X2 [Aphelenchoides avenae]|nr:inner centromere protein-like isoform X2 [Aphelenchus avenae]
MAVSFNNLVVRVVRAKGIPLKNGKPIDVYVSLATSGKGNWKSKVTTNPSRAENGDVEWDEHCEFQLTDTDTQLDIHVNHKTVFGTTETLGQVHFELSEMPRFQQMAWFRLTKRHNEEKDRGQLMLEYEFSNKFATSISTMSLNKIDKERKLDKLKRKMHIGKRKSKFDSQSMASVSLSRRSSISSMASGLAFNSPSPNQMHRLNEHDPGADNLSQYSAHDYASPGKGPAADSFVTAPDSSFMSPCELSTIMEKSATLNVPPSASSKSGHADYDTRSFTGDFAAAPAKSARHGLGSKMLEKAGNIFRRKSDFGDDQSAPTGHGHLAPSGSRSRQPSTNSAHISIPVPPQSTIPGSSRPQSIASSSGFASLGSGNLATLNEHTSPQYLLHVIQHLRKESQQKEARIRDLETYLDGLLSRVIETHPELLQTPAQP